MFFSALKKHFLQTESLIQDFLEYNFRSQFNSYNALSIRGTANKFFVVAGGDLLSAENNQS